MERVNCAVEIVKRGYEPKDAMEFGSKAAEKLNAAGQELVFLLNRGYDVKSASTFIGNHHLLSERQRLALARITSTKAALMERRRKELTQAPAELVFDGFNTIITMEVALSGSLLLAGMDGTIRDLAELRGTYRIVDKTVRAVELLFAHLDELGVKKALFYLDQQVSNSGRLRALLLDQARDHAVEVQAELHPSVDGLLSRMERVVTADAIILDKCGSWYNLNRKLIQSAVPDAWIFRLDGLRTEGFHANHRSYHRPPPAYHHPHCRARPGTGSPGHHRRLPRRCQTSRCMGAGGADRHHAPSGHVRRLLSHLPRQGRVRRYVRLRCVPDPADGGI